MGDWNITIQGTGVHHNVSKELPEDADRMTADFVQALLDAGHKIHSATFTSGSRLEYANRQKRPLPEQEPG